MQTIVLWDIDGTLLHTEGMGGACFREAVKLHCDLTQDPERISFAGQTDWGMAKRYMELYAPHACDAEAWMRALLERYAEHFEDTYAAGGMGYLYPHVEKALEWLQKKGVQQALVTGNMRRTAHAKLSRFGLERFFPKGGFSDGEGDRALIAAHALRELGAHGDERVTLIGDTANDILAARSIGARAVVLGHMFDRGHFTGGEPDLYLSSLDPWEEKQELLAAVIFGE